jgi:hypothetical protein
MSGGEPVKKKAKYKTKRVIAYQIEGRIITLISAHDVEWFVKKVKVLDARKFIEGITGSKISAGKFKAHVDHCKANGQLKFWRVARRKGEAKHNLLTNEQWEKLRFTVFDMSMDLRGRSLAEGVMIISTRVRTNVVQLLGLPKRLHFWLDQSAE